MYLSRVRVATEGLDPKDFYDLLQGNAYGSHQLLWKLFPDQDSRAFLFRQELEQEAPLNEGLPRALPLFYVLSRDEPQTAPGLLEPETKLFSPKLKTGQHLAFRLRANPVVARKERGRKNSRHHDVLMDAKKGARAEGLQNSLGIQERMYEAARQWLSDERRTERAGYRPLGSPQASSYRQHVYRAKGRDIRFSSVDYEGILEVADPVRFCETLARGVGRSRAFGCGMWMIRKP